MASSRLKAVQCSAAKLRTARCSALLRVAHNFSCLSGLFRWEEFTDHPHSELQRGDDGVSRIIPQLAARPRRKLPQQE
ncbi:hypothetical protein MRX96_015887 [Rhipicephalus microplus]